MSESTRCVAAMHALRPRQRSAGTSHSGRNAVSGSEAQSRSADLNGRSVCSAPPSGTLRPGAAGTRVEQRSRAIATIGGGRNTLAPANRHEPGLGKFRFRASSRAGESAVLVCGIRRRNSELAFCLAPLAQPGDCLWTPEPPDVEFAAHVAEVGVPGVRFVSKVEDVPPGTTIVPWGWCRAADEWAAKNGWTRSTRSGRRRAVNSPSFPARSKRNGASGCPALSRFAHCPNSIAF